MGRVPARGATATAEKLLKNVKTELWNEYEEIGNYVAIESLAKAVGDKDTEKLAREFRKQEERMAAFLHKLLPQLGKAVAVEEIPPAQRRTNGASRASSPRRRTRSTASSSRSKSAASSRSTSSRSTSSRSKPTTSSRSKPASSSRRSKPAASSRSRRKAS
jgi:rubrerythrin